MMKSKTIATHIITLSLFSTAPQILAKNGESQWQKAQKAFGEKASEVKETVSQKLSEAKEAITPYAKAAKEKLKNVAGEVKQSVKSGIKELDKKSKNFYQATGEQLLRTLAGEPKLPAFRLTNIYGKQLKLKIYNMNGKKLNKIYIDPGDNYTMDTIPEIVVANYRGMKQTRNGLALNVQPTLQKETNNHALITTWLSQDKVQFDTIGGIKNNISIERINQAKETFDDFWKSFEQKKSKEESSVVQEIKKSAQNIKKGYKDVARQALQTEEKLKPYIEMAE